MTSKLAGAIYRQPFSILANPPVQHDEAHKEEKKAYLMPVVSRKKMERSNDTMSTTFSILCLLPGLDSFVVWPWY
jgi:hypothetical protein